MDAMRLRMLFFCFLLAVVSAVNRLNRLNNINNLKNVGYGMQAPRHRLQLLNWFSQRVLNIDSNTMPTLSLNLNPTRDDFGFHCFHNIEGILPLLGSGRTYCSVGNLNSRGANALPDYVRQNKNAGLEANMDRLIISVNRNLPNRVFNVYITSHNRGRNDFNCSDTYEINPKLIAEIRVPHICPIDNNEANNREYERFLWLQTQMENNRRTKRSADLSCDTLGKFKLEIRANKYGYSKLIWKDLSAEVMKEYYVNIEMCKNNHLVFNSEHECQSQIKKIILNFQLSGTLDTLVPLNGNLQPRLQLKKNYLGKSFFCYGPELDDANGVIPTRIKGFDASLQLYTENGKACARLYIKKTFSNWKIDFYYSWVGFYSSSQEPNNNHDKYQFATNFEKVEDIIEDYDIYIYKSSLAIAPGVQIRFFLDNNYNKVLARTTPWEDAEEMMISPSDCENINTKNLSHWYSPEFFYRPEFDDANRVIPTQIKGFNASLQLYTKDGKACARLYIRKTFKNWKNAFSYSWVGFYSSSQKPNDSYNTYKNAVKFDKVEDIQDYEIYDYKSSLKIAPGIQIRFLQDKEYNSELARTPQWIGS